MPYLKVIMMTANEELDHNHLADSVECITMVWLAVGKDKIRSDIEMVMVNNNFYRNLNWLWLLSE
jgi:hypothetical protein